MASVAVDVLLSGIRDTSGSPLAAGLVYTYEPGTTTPRALYTDTGLTTPAANPVVLDAYGMATCYADNTYKFVVKTSGGTTLYTWDNLNFQAPADDDFPNGGNAGGANRTMGNTDNYSLGLLTNNSNRLHITNAGDVGIGTTSPAFQLHVVDNSSTLGGMKIESSQNNVGTAIDLYCNGSNASARNWRIDTNSTAGVLSILRSTTSSSAPSVNMFTLTSSGHVGIGTATPDKPLNIEGDYGNFLAEAYNTRSSGTSNVLYIHSASTDSTAQVLNVQSSFSVKGDGRVGVGTLAPSSMLDVNGEIKCATICTNTSYSWTLAGYTATAPAATGYITVTIEGTTYKLLAST